MFPWKTRTGITEDYISITAWNCHLQHQERAIQIARQLNGLGEELWVQHTTSNLLTTRKAEEPSDAESSGETGSENDEAVEEAEESDASTRKRVKRRSKATGKQHDAANVSRFRVRKSCQLTHVAGQAPQRPDEWRNPAKSSKIVRPCIPGQRNLHGGNLRSERPPSQPSRSLKRSYHRWPRCDRQVESESSRSTVRTFRHVLTIDTSSKL